MVRVGAGQADDAPASHTGSIAPDSSLSPSFPCGDPAPGRAGAAVHLACDSRSDAESSHTLPVAVSITRTAPGSFSGAYRPDRGTTKPSSAPSTSPATSPSKSQTKCRSLIPLSYREAPSVSASARSRAPKLLERSCPGTMKEMATAFSISEYRCSWLSTHSRNKNGSSARAAYPL